MDAGTHTGGTEEKIFIYTLVHMNGGDRREEQWHVYYVTASIQSCWLEDILPYSGKLSMEKTFANW